MTANEFHQVILDTLQGRTGELRSIPRERLDWAGPGTFLELFRKTSGSDRTALIEAMGRVIEDQATPPAVLAQVIQIASSLDLAQLEPQVRELRERATDAEGPVRSAINNYLVYRELNASPETLMRSRDGNEKPSTRETRAVARAEGEVE